MPSTSPEPVAAPIRFQLSSAGQRAYNLGTVTRGERTTVPCVVRNDTPAAVTVGPFQTSCECFSVELIRSVIPSGEQVSGTLVVDLAKEPQFQGGLMLTAEAPVAGGPHPLSIRLTVTTR